MSAFAIGTGALARSALGGGGAAFVLFIRLALIRSSLSGHLGNPVTLACERLAVASPAVLPTFAIGTGAFVGCAIISIDPARTTCVFFIRLALIRGCFPRLFCVVSTRASECLAVASPAVVIAVGSGTSTPGG